MSKTLFRRSRRRARASLFHPPVNRSFCFPITRSRPLPLHPEIRRAPTVFSHHPFDNEFIFEQ